MPFTLITRSSPTIAVPFASTKLPEILYTAPTVDSVGSTFILKVELCSFAVILVNSSCVTLSYPVLAS